MSRTLSRQSQQITLPGQTTKTQTAQTGSLWRTIGALLVVLALFLLGAKLWRKQIPVANIGLPTEAIEILGRKPIEPHLSVYLIRCGTRILVVGSSADGMQTLAEVTDPVEVDYLAGICRRSDQENSFAQSLRTFFNRRSSSHATPEQTLQSFEVDDDENEKTIGQLNIDPSTGYDQKSETVHA
ncbi:MAG: flagellar biosynthetic protein FliO [Planctomycetes bacterium]|nr:flagellar biosynthetic protein FliO [Planctomycetota bacterium]